MAHYHAPPEFCGLLQSWYSGLLATLSTLDWVTSPNPLKMGVYQGDPVSVVTMMNILSDTDKTLGFPSFHLPSPSTSCSMLMISDQQYNCWLPVPDGYDTVVVGVATTCS